MSDVSDSKFLSLILRHNPDCVGVTLDGQGWIAIDQLLAAIKRHGNSMSRKRLDYLVTNCPKQRFAISPDGRSIRANQGHSLTVDLDLPPAEPPPVLYHGTVAKFLPGILAEGLTKQARHHVHLSPDVETATRVGARRGQPVILQIDGAAMHRAGHLFYLSANGVWLTDKVPSQYLQRPE